MSDRGSKEIASNADGEERRTRGEYRRAVAPGLPPTPQRSSTAPGATARHRSASPTPTPGVMRSVHFLWLRSAVADGLARLGCKSSFCSIGLGTDHTVRLYWLTSVLSVGWGIERRLTLDEVWR